MPISRRRAVTGLLAGLGATCLSLLSPFAAALELEEGRNFRTLSSAPPQPDGQTIEVLEFFSYGCPHCADLNPLIKEWAAQQPDDVAFKRVPVSFGRAAWQNLVRLFYALEFAGELEALDQRVFEAVTEERVNLYTERNVRRWVEQQGLDPEIFASYFDSFAVEAALARARTLEERYRIRAVPSVVVDGRYLVLNDGVRTHRQMLEVAEALTDKARTARAAAGED